ncbi:putative tetratricopeptide-like helical domain superfamily [Septoria linicola]|nr:putative tetratricopeptide-like helical domain superfamily [Septoria linicola]
MLSLLSRAAQIGNLCRCQQCLPHAQGVAKVVSAAGSVLRPRYQSFSTAWTADDPIVAATNGRDANYQTPRQWDQPSTNHEGEFHTGPAGGAEVLLEEQSILRERDVFHAGQMDISNDVTPNINVRPIEALKVSEDLQADLERNLDSSAERKYVPQWPTNTGRQLHRHHLPPQSIYAVRRRKREAATTRWYEKKLLRVQLSMDMLQLKFFMWLRARGPVHRFVSSVPDPYANIILQHPRVLQREFTQKKSDFDRLLSTHSNESGSFVFARSSGDVPLCHYAEDDLGTFRNQQRELQQSIKLIFDQTYARKYSGTDVAGIDWDVRMRGLVEIFWRLSSSPAPPNLDVYNTLITCLRREEHPQLTEHVISCFVSSKMRPNEVSLASILGFYTDTDNVLRFRRWVQLMRGNFGGLMASAPWIRRFKASNGRIKERDDKPGNYVQLPHPTPIVFDALVKGVLHFSGFGAALELCRNLSDEGWGMDLRGFGILLNDCAVRGDWDSGFAIWSQILALQQKSIKAGDGRTEAETIMTPLFADMLRLCRRCDKRHEFADVWAQASRTHPKAIHRIMDIVKAEGAALGESHSAAEQDVEDAQAVSPSNATVALAEDRNQAMEALAKLRVQSVGNTDNRALYQEYLALQADVDFLKTLESKGAGSKPRARTWSELAKSAYNLIASHPETLEKRTSNHRVAQGMRKHDETRPVSYSDLAKNAYHLVADHPSTLEQRKMQPPLQGSIDLAQDDSQQLSSSIDFGENVDGAASPQTVGHRLVSKSTRSGETVSYTSLVSSAYHLIADHPSTLERRKQNHGARDIAEQAGADEDSSPHSSGERKSQSTKPVTMAQLHGHESGSDELDDYEAGERPMSHSRS